MADDSQQDAGAPADPGRARRAPPTIDLEATDVTTAPKQDESHDGNPDTNQDTGDATTGLGAGAATEPGGAKDGEKEPQGGPGPAPEQPAAAASASRTRSISPWVIAPLSGVVAAALVIAVGWMLGWLQLEPPAPTAPQVSAAAVDQLRARVAGLEAKLNQLPAPGVDPALPARADALEKSLASVRGEVANLRTQSDRLAADINTLKSAPHDASGTVDLSGINDRIAQLERASRAQGSEIAQNGAKIADSKPADDLALRRVVAAALLDVAVRHDDPYQSELAAAKALAPDPDVLKPLEPFAATGVPKPFMLNRELLALVQKLSPTPPAAPSTTGSSILDRLQAGAAKLVRVERTDAAGNDRGAVVARITAAALRNDLPEAQRELEALPPAERAPAQGWLDKVAARDAALAASHQFADQAMAALAKPGP